MLSVLQSRPELGELSQLAVGTNNGPRDLHGLACQEGLLIPADHRALEGFTLLLSTRDKCTFLHVNATATRKLHVLSLFRLHLHAF